jgi:hypothetical protein
MANNNSGFCPPASSTYRDCRLSAKLVAMGDRHLTLTTTPPSVNRLSKNVGASTSHNSMNLHGLSQGQFLLSEGRADKEREREREKKVGGW